MARIFVLLLTLQVVVCCVGFSPGQAQTRANEIKLQRSTVVLQLEEDSDNDGSSTSDTKLSMEEKMKSWEASEDEMKAATFGGVVPGRGENRSDAFDIGLYIAFPLMVLSGLAFALFPFLMGNIDTSSVGPPPTI